MNTYLIKIAGMFAEAKGLKGVGVKMMNSAADHGLIHQGGLTSKGSKIVGGASVAGAVATSLPKKKIEE